MKKTPKLAEAELAAIEALVEPRHERLKPDEPLFALLESLARLTVEIRESRATIACYERAIVAWACDSDEDRAATTDALLAIADDVKTNEEPAK